MFFFASNFRSKWLVLSKPLANPPVAKLLANNSPPRHALLLLRLRGKYTKSIYRIFCFIFACFHDIWNLVWIYKVNRGLQYSLLGGFLYFWFIKVVQWEWIVSQLVVWIFMINGFCYLSKSCGGRPWLEPIGDLPLDISCLERLVVFVMLWILTLCLLFWIWRLQESLLPPLVVSRSLIVTVLEL